MLYCVKVLIISDWEFLSWDNRSCESDPDALIQNTRLSQSNVSRTFFSVWQYRRYRRVIDNSIPSDRPMTPAESLLIVIPFSCGRYAWLCWTRTTWHRRGARDRGNSISPKRRRPIPSSRCSRPTIRIPSVLWLTPWCRIIIVPTIAACSRQTTRRRANLICIRPPVSWASPNLSTGRRRRDTCSRCAPTTACNIRTLCFTYRWECETWAKWRVKRYISCRK